MSHRIDQLAITLLVSIGIALLPHAGGALPGGGVVGVGGVAAPQKQHTPEMWAAISY